MTRPGVIGLQVWVVVGFCAFVVAPRPGEGVGGARREVFRWGESRPTGLLGSAREVDG